MAIQKIVKIRLDLDCTPPEGSSDTPLEIFQSVINKVTTFLSSEDSSSKAVEDFNSMTNILNLKITVPVANIDAAKVIETKLTNALSTFPPRVNRSESRFIYIMRERIEA